MGPTCLWFLRVSCPGHTGQHQLPGPTSLGPHVCCAELTGPLCLREALADLSRVWGRTCLPVLGGQSRALAPSTGRTRQHDHRSGGPCKAPITGERRTSHIPTCWTTKIKPHAPRFLASWEERKEPKGPQLKVYLTHEPLQT